MMTLYFRKPGERTVGYIQQIVDLFNEKPIKKREDKVREEKTAQRIGGAKPFCFSSGGVS